MTIESLKRVLWRVRKNNPDNKRPSYSELERAVILECGSTPQTYYNAKRALLKVHYIAPHNQTRFELTNKDLSDS